MATAPATTLYSREILRLATVLPLGDQLDAPTATATRRAPVCGSEISADIVLGEAGKVAALALRARACALGQASAALVREHAIGHDAQQIAAIRTALAQALAGKGRIPECWPALALFEAAITHPGRHGAILLPYDALLAAMDQAGAG